MRRRHDRPLRFSAWLRRRLGALLDPPPLSEAAMTAMLDTDTADLRERFAAYGEAHGSDALISLLKIELVTLGEGGKTLDVLVTTARSAEAARKSKAKR